MSLFNPDPLLLSRTDRAEAWIWRQRWAYALVGWVLYLFPKGDKP